MSASFASVQWPAIIKLHADDELMYVADAEGFFSDHALQQIQLMEQDRLIDSSGAVYHINKTSTLTLIPAGIHLSLEQIDALLRRHLSNRGSCCVSKLHSNSISDAIADVMNLQD